MEISNTNVTLHVADMDASIAFYRSIGFTLKQRWDNHYAQLTAPGIEIGLHPGGVNPDPGDREGISIGFSTPDFEKVKQDFVQMGMPFESRREAGGEFLHFRDPDGTALYFIRPKWG